MESYNVLSVVTSFLHLMCVCSVMSDSVAHQSTLSMEFSKQEHWSGFPCPSLEDLPDPGTEAVLPALAGRFFTTVPPGKP